MGVQYNQIQQDPEKEQGEVYAVAVAEAEVTPVSSFHDEYVVEDGAIEQVQQVGDDDDDDDGKPAAASAAPQMVRVVAPCDLPYGYKLLVKTSNGDVFDVVIPEGGVERGEVFEAERPRPKPILGQFSDGLFDCCGEGNFFWLALCCPGVAFAAIMEKLGLNWLGNRSFDPSPNTFVIVTILWLSFCFFLRVIPYVNVLFVVWFVIIKANTRLAARENYQIFGSGCGDCVYGTFCQCCTALQIFRHMKRSGNRIERFETTVHAEIV